MLNGVCHCRIVSKWLQPVTSVIRVNVLTVQLGGLCTNSHRGCSLAAERQTGKENSASCKMPLVFYKEWQAPTPSNWNIFSLLFFTL